ncbi:MAG: ankyrin repeat domain-containing protein, partial [Candidatus Binatia bacterium]
MQRRHAISIVIVLVLGLSFSPSVFAGELHEAVKARAVEKVRQLLVQGADPNAEEETRGASADFSSGKTALHVALSQGALDIVELLLAHGADVNAQDSNGHTPLFYAAKNVELAKLLLARGVRVNMGDISGQTPLHSAAWAGDAAVVKLLLAHGADLDVQNNSGVSPLDTALQRGTPEVVELFRSHEAQLNAGATFASTLLSAVKAGELEKVKELLRQGGNANARVHVVKRVGPVYIPPMVCVASPTRHDGTSFGSQFPLYAAITQGSREMVELLLTHKADPNARDSVSGRTALHIAVAQGSQELTALLLAHKADVNVLDICGQTPLFYTLNNVELTKLLLAQRARCNLNNSEARSLLSVALQHGHPEVVKLLRTHGAAMRDGRVFTPALMEAAKTG